MDVSVTIPTVWIVLPVILICVGVWAYASWVITNWIFDSLGRWWFKRKGWGDYDELKERSFR